jgi:hypothetical protein
VHGNAPKSAHEARTMAQYNPNIHKRRSIRLKGYDYRSEGVYFLTICAVEKKRIFRRIQGGLMFANELGQIVEAEWLKSGEIRKEIILDDYVLMPNHFHALVIIDRAGEVLPDEPLCTPCKINSQSRFRNLREASAVRDESYLG